MLGEGKIYVCLLSGVSSEERHFRDFSLRVDAEYVLWDQWVWNKVIKNT